MSDLALFDLASHRSRWLAAKGAAIAGNVANADTPGFHARDVESFSEMLAKLDPTQADSNRSAVRLVDRQAESQKLSGNSVSLEREMFELGEARSHQALVTGVSSTFHRLLLSVSRG